jgi:hypothetical protein
MEVVSSVTYLLTNADKQKKKTFFSVGYIVFSLLRPNNISWSTGTSEM